MLALSAICVIASWNRTVELNLNIFAVVYTSVVLMGGRAFEKQAVK